MSIRSRASRSANSNRRTRKEVSVSWIYTEMKDNKLLYIFVATSSAVSVVS